MEAAKLEQQAVARRGPDASGWQAKQTLAAAEPEAAARRESGVSGRHIAAVALPEQQPTAGAAAVAEQEAAARRTLAQAEWEAQQAAMAQQAAASTSDAGRANMSAPIAGLLTFFASATRVLNLSSQVSSRPFAPSQMPLLAGRCTALRACPQP